VPLGLLVTGLLWCAGQPILAIGYLLAAIAVSLLCLTVLSGGGRSYARCERLERTKTATMRITNQFWSSWAIVLALAALIIAIPILAAVWFRESLPWAIAAETVFLSLILAIEGRREYRLFSRRFDRLNSRLPGLTANR
jgi:hypothetical protein